MSLTGQLCERIAAVSYADLDERALREARRLFLDGIAIAVAGVEEDAIRILADHFQEQGGAPQATALGLGFRLNTVSAAALNGAAMHVLDFEPMWSPANHALSTTLPAILALAEQRGASGREVITALVKGTEIQGWLREASGQFEPRLVTFHPPGVVGPIGAAVAAGHLLGLGPLQLAYAIAIAASRSASLLSNVGTMTKSTHCGHAAALGLEAALLAERGFNGNPDIFGAPQSFGEGFYKETFRPDLLLGFGPPFRLVDPGYAVKMFPSQFGTHFGITAALELHRKLPPGARIERVVLTAPVMPYVDRPLPPTGLAGKFSLQYTAASALLDGKVAIDTFTDARLARRDMQDLLSRFELRMDPAIPARFEEMHVLLRVELSDGAVLETRCSAPRGFWGEAPISRDEHDAKVRDCLERRLDAGSIEEIMAAAHRVDALDGRDIASLIQLAGCFSLEDA